MEISLKKEKVASCLSLHSSGFADTFFCEEPDLFRAAKQELRVVITKANTQFSGGEKNPASGAELFQPDGNAGTTANGCRLAMTDPELEIK